MKNQFSDRIFVPSGSTFMHEFYFDPLKNEGKDANMNGYSRRDGSIEPMDKTGVLRNMVARILDRYLPKMAVMEVYQKNDLSQGTFENNRTLLFTIYPTGIQLNCTGHKTVGELKEFLDKLNHKLKTGDHNILDLMESLKRRKRAKIYQSYIFSNSFKTLDELERHCQAEKLQGIDASLIEEFKSHYIKMYFAA
ncbi:hypothetical protein R9C00_19665 [Flammeovirgaceae bacterium SG7u.111]|nr:hypothetical protein [Flammeovirgaceae bacterium SG7u.132]WPO33920.1 hypothetical protein R9C00_19665 [Flammeovirgaceae bacterium SG7u.111]